MLNEASIDGAQRAEAIRKGRITIEAGKIFHSTAKQYLDNGYITQEQYSSAFKFAVIRNPLDRLASMHRYLVRTTLIEPYCQEAFFFRWLPQTLEDSNSKMHYFVIPQYDFVYDNGNLLVDQLVRFENFQEEIKVVNSKIKVPAVVPVMNNTDRSKYADLAENKYIVRLVKELYAKDYETFYPELL